MEEKRVRGKNFTEFEKNFLFDLVSTKYKEVIENKQSDGVTVAKKNLAWHEIAKEFNSSNQTGHRSAKQLHALYDNLKKTARSNILDDKKNAYKTGGGRFTPKSAELDAKIASVLKQQFEPLSNRYDSSANFIEQRAGPSSCNTIIENYNINIEDMPVVFDDSTANDSLNITEEDNSNNPPSPTPSLPDVTPAPAPRQIPSLSQKRKRIAGNSSISKKRKLCIETLSNRFVERKNYKDQSDEEIKLKKLEILNLEKEIKIKQLAIVEQQLQQERQLYELNLQNKLEEIEFERKVREIKLTQMYRN